VNEHSEEVFKWIITDTLTHLPEAEGRDIGPIFHDDYPLCSLGVSPPSIAPQEQEHAID